VDQFLNIKLTDITVTDQEKYPHMVSNKADVSTEIKTNKKHFTLFCHPGVSDTGQVECSHL